MRSIKITPEISRPNDKDNYGRYVKEIGKLKPLSKEEEVETFKLVEIGDQKAIDKICKHNLLFVISVAKKYSSIINQTALTLEDLICEGNIGMLIAIKKYDYRTGNKFISYAVWWIRQAIHLSIANNIKSIRIPVYVRGVITKIKKKQDDLSQKLCRAPTTLETFEAMLEDEEKLPVFFSTQKLEEMMLISRFEVSINSPISGDTLTEISETIVSDDDGPSEILIQKERKEFLVKILNDLPPNIKDYFNDYYGINGNRPLTIDEIADKYDEYPQAVGKRINKWLRYLKITNKLDGEVYFPSSNYQTNYEIKRKFEKIEKNTIYLI